MKKLFLLIFALMLVCNVNAQQKPVQIYSDGTLSVKFGFGGAEGLDGVFVFLDSKTEYCELAYMLPHIIVGVVFTDDTFLRLYKIPEIDLSNKQYDTDTQQYHTDYFFFCDDAKQLFAKRIKRLVSVKTGGRREFDLTIDANKRASIQQNLRIEYNKYKASAK